MKTLTLHIFLLLLAFVIGVHILTAPDMSFAQEEINVVSEEIAYTLPHAGILPDNPLYVFKKVRDSFWVFFTRDNVEKAEVLLLLYDKKIVMAQALADKGKWEHTVDTVIASEEDLEKLIDSVEMAKKIGSSPSPEFIDTVLLSTDKHFEIMENLLKTSPQGIREQIEEAMKTNVVHHNTLDAF